MSRISRYTQQVTPTKKKWQAGVYLRLSREDELTKDKNSYSIETQRMIINKFLAAHPDIEVVDFYIDDGFSGTNMERPGYKRLKDDFENKKINCIIIKDLSRLARNNEEAGKLVFVVFPFYGIRFISVNDKVDSYLDPKSVNNISIQFKNLMNDEYSRDLSKKVKSARLTRQKRGEFLGSFAPYGYDKEPKDHHKLIVDPVAAEIVKLIFKKFLEGETFSSIASYLSINEVLTPCLYKRSRGMKLYNPNNDKFIMWNGGTVRNILQDEVYTGTLVQGRRKKISYKAKKFMAVNKEDWLRFENAHEAIISKEDFEKVQELLEKKKMPTRDTKAKNIYLGLVFCGECGHAMALSSKKSYSTYQAFYCKFFKKEKAYCSRKRIKVSVLSDIIIIALNQYLRFYVSLENVMKTLNKQADKMLTKNQKDELDKQLMNLREEKKNLYIQFKCEAITRKQYEEGRAMCDSRMLQIENRLKEVDESVSTTKEMEKNLFIELFKKYKKFTKLNREILETFVKKITVYSSKSLEIEWNFNDDLIELVNMAQEKGIELVMNEQNTLELPPKGSHRNIS